MTKLYHSKSVLHYQILILTASVSFLMSAFFQPLPKFVSELEIPSTGSNWDWNLRPSFSNTITPRFSRQSEVCVHARPLSQVPAYCQPCGIGGPVLATEQYLSQINWFSTVENFLGSQYWVIFCSRWHVEPSDLLQCCGGSVSPAPPTNCSGCLILL